MPHSKYQNTNTDAEMQGEIAGMSIMSVLNKISKITVLPEGCISKILSLTSPRDACTSAVVSNTFKLAADSDMVWEKFLPPNYKEMVLKSPSGIRLSDFPSRKELYFHLCRDPLLLEGGKTSLILDKQSGKKSFMIGANKLDIIWGDSPQYWKWTSHSNSRFPEDAELLSVCWLDIRGQVETRILSPKTTYEVYFVVKFTDDAYGLDHPPAQVSVEFVSGVGTASGSRAVYLDPECNRRPHVQYVPNRLGLIRRRLGHILRPALSSIPRYESQFPKDREDGWMEIEMGHFYNDEGEDGEVKMTLTETKGGHWKAGLIVQGIEIRAKEN